MPGTIRATRTQLAQSSIYNGHMPYQSGGSFMSVAKTGIEGATAANAAAKKHKIITNAAKIVSALGATAFLDKKTGGLYSKGVGYAQQAGYGRRKRRKSTRKRRTK